VAQIMASGVETCRQLQSEIDRKNIQIEALNGVVEELSAPLEDDRDEPVTDPTPTDAQ